MLIRDQHPEKLDTPRNSIYHLISKFPSTKNKNKVTFKISIQEGFTSLLSCQQGGSIKYFQLHMDSQTGSLGFQDFDLSQIGEFSNFFEIDLSSRIILVSVCCRGRLDFFFTKNGFSLRVLLKKVDGEFMPGGGSVFFFPRENEKCPRSHFFAIFSGFFSGGIYFSRPILHKLSQYFAIKLRELYSKCHWSSPFSPFNISMSLAFISFKCWHHL